MFKHLVALVTNASSGIGKATAEHFVAKGARVVLCDASTSNGAAVAAAIGKQALFVPTDLNSESDGSSLMTTIEEQFGALNVIVNCHSVTSPFTSPAYNFETKLPHSLEDFRKSIIAGPFSTFNVVRLGVGLMLKNKRNIHDDKGVIINALSPVNHLSGHVAANAANGCIVGLTETWAVEFATQGIRVMAIAQDNIVDESTSTQTASGTPLHFAHLAHLVVTTPYLNSTIITLDGCVHRTT